MLHNDPNALQVRVYLEFAEPAIWRRLVVPWTWHLGELPLAIQAAFNWWNYHLHESQIGGLRYGDPEHDDGGFEDSPRLFDEKEVRLLDFGRDVRSTFTYVYDFGDNWHHTVAVEQLLSAAPGQDHLKTWAALAALRSSWPSWPTQAIQSTPARNVGAAAASILNGSTLP